MGYSYNPKSLCADEFINDEEILETLAFADAQEVASASITPLRAAYLQ